MGLKKAAGILICSTQAVIGADYYIQTRDAGLGWGDLSATDYSTIVQDRFARARAAKAAEGEGTTWDDVASYGKSLLGRGEQLAEAPAAAQEEPINPICVRRGTTADC